VLIYDLGGGTFNASVLAIKGTNFKVRSTIGDFHLGGEDFNSRMVDHFVKEFKKTHKKDISTNEKALSRLRIACDRAKRLLSTSTEAPIRIESLFEGIDFQSSITRARFEGLNEDLFCSTLDMVAQAIKDAGLEKTEIKEVVLVGGSTRILKIQKLLEYYFYRPNELNNSVNPDEAVATGAAIQAAFLNGDKSDALKNLALIEVVPLSLGIGLVGGITDFVIKRNSTIPATRIATYFTSYDDQKSLTFDICEGERVMTKDNKRLGNIRFNGITPAPKGETKVEVTYLVGAVS